MMCQRKFYHLLVLVVVFVLVSGVSSSQNLEGKANYICFSCPLSEAESIDMVYNKHSTAGDFWLRNGSALTSCDFSSVYASKRKCSVCLKNPVGAETVVMVLCNLTSWEEPIFEGQHGDISFNKTDCPQPKPSTLFEPSPQRDATQTNGRSAGPFISTACLFAVLVLGLIIMIIIIVWKCHKSQQNPVDGSNTNSSDPENGAGV
ncbi:uncharacterized protein LOC102235450 [Xiphophorus maculatus]|uniref:uncharacterized protein LOC102235450 n=1 Tax=Xiphophorus maculatus TaxID=8083 RepID=UPI0003B59771|nr:uncharacterized protein LOC102235450 [Xiphophorus maculatus]